MRLPRLIAAAPVVALAAACGATAETINVEIAVTGESVTQAVVERDGRSETVDLPWSTSVKVKDGPGIDSFTVVATNPTEQGELTCAADWKQASDDGTWSRTASYQVSCGGRVSFDDTGVVRLDPTGRSISFEERDEAIAEEAAVASAEVARQARVAAARLPAVAELESARVGDWDIVASGVLRDAGDYIRDLTGSRANGRGAPLITEISATYQGTGLGQPRDLAFVLVGGYDLERLQTFDASCGAIPEPAYDVVDVPPRETVSFNVCWQVDERDAPDAFIEVDQHGVGVDVEPVAMLLPAAEGLRGALRGAQAGEQSVGDEWSIAVTDVRIDDLDKLRERDADMEAPRDGRSYLWLEARVTNLADYEEWPASFYSQWFISAADGVTRYDDGYGDRCPGYSSPLVDRKTTDPLIEPGETQVVEHCWEVASRDVEDATLLIATPTGDARFILEPSAPTE